jgi:hypothetical protein
MSPEKVAVETGDGFVALLEECGGSSPSANSGSE